MCTTDIQLVEAYGKGNPHERFIMIYKNYEVFPKLVESYETGLFNRILYEREYNIRAKFQSDDLGVRINTNKISDTTAKKAIERILIRDAIEKADFNKSWMFEGIGGNHQQVEQSELSGHRHCLPICEKTD